MKQPATIPILGKAIRFGPSRYAAPTAPAAMLWKVWAVGSEVYATARYPGGMWKCSVHASGQVHSWQGKKSKEVMAPALRLGLSQWFHALEIRFLLSDGALMPPSYLTSLKNELAYLIPVPAGYVLYANLIVGCRGTPLDAPLPSELLPSGYPIWRTLLRDGRPAVLVARLLKLDEPNRREIWEIREEQRPTVNLTGGRVGTNYVEIFKLHWSQHGSNVVLVVPLGAEAFRFEDDALPPSGLGTPRNFNYQSSSSALDLLAPDGRRIAVINLTEADAQLDLVKNRRTDVELGQVSIQIDPHNLVRGGKFMTAPSRLNYMFNIDGASPRQWGCPVHAEFDGYKLSVELRLSSVSMQNRNLSSPILRLESGEEIVVVVPAESLKLVATMDDPTCSIALTGKFTLRDHL